MERILRLPEPERGSYGSVFEYGGGGKRGREHIVSSHVRHLYRTWILEDANRLSLKNMIAFYTDAPAALRLEVHLSDKGSDKKETEEKIRRRYSHLHDGKTDDSAGISYGIEF